MEKNDIPVKKVINKKGVRVQKCPGYNDVSFPIQIGTIVTVIDEWRDYVKIDTGPFSPFNGWVLKRDLRDVEMYPPFSEIPSYCSYPLHPDIPDYPNVAQKS